MDIKVGEYVRTRTQGIKRIDTIFENRPINRYGYEIGWEWDGKLYSIIKTTDILNHSFKPINLIEAGDYVNGYPVRKINGKLCNFDLNEMEWTPLENIDVWENIVTKEQFESMEYKVGD